MSKKIENFKTEMLAAITARADYERAKNSDNENMQRTLQDLSKTVCNEVASAFMSAKVSADFINRAERSNARFNVYAAQKVMNVARIAANVQHERLNHYSLAIMQSIIALAATDMNLSHKDAISACSLNVNVDTAKRAHIVQYQKHVAANTASTQASSSLNALQMMNVISETRDASNATCYVLTDSETCKTVIAAISK